MKSLVFVASAMCSVIALGACAPSEQVDELAGSSEEDGADAKADGAGGVYTYFEISRDMRKCASPMCGGFFLDRLNHATTKCVDGQYQDQCYAPELDMSEAGLSAAAFDKLNAAATKSSGGGVHAIVRGRFAKGNSTPSPTLGRFVVTEAWVSQSDAVASGVFAKIADNGVRCIAAPCSSTTEKGLNTSRSANIAEVDFSESGVSDSVLAEVGNDMFTPSGVIIAGDRYSFKFEGRKGKGRTATAVFRRLLETNDAACFVGGCSSQVCSDQEGVITTCEWRPEYACYADATCERQAAGECGWTATPALATCLGN